MENLIIQFMNLYKRFILIKILYFLIAFSIAVYAKILVYNCSLLIKCIVGSLGIVLIFLPTFKK